MIWRFETAAIDVTSTPAVAEGSVFIGGADGHVYALDTHTGNPIWSYKTHGPIYSSAAMAGNKVFLASQDENLYALDKTSGEPNWTRPIGKIASGAPTVHDETLYVGTRNGTFLALDSQSGRLEWQISLPELGRHSGTGYSIPGSPLVVDDLVIFGSTDRHVYALERHTGELIWEFRSNGTFSGSASTDGEHVFITNSRGTVYAFVAENGDVLWEHSAGIGSDGSPSYRSGSLFFTGFSGVTSLDAMTGEINWNYPKTEGGPQHLTVSHTTVYSSDLDGTLIALNLFTGEELWRNQIAAFINSSPVVVDGLLYVGSNQFYVFALDAGAGLEPMPSADRPAGADPQRIPALAPLATILAIMMVWRLNPRNRPHA